MVDGRCEVVGCRWQASDGILKVIDVGGWNKMVGVCGEVVDGRWKMRGGGWLA